MNVSEVTTVPHVTPMIFGGITTRLIALKIDGPLSRVIVSQFPTTRRKRDFGMRTLCRFAVNDGWGRM